MIYLSCSSERESLSPVLTQFLQKLSSGSKIRLAITWMLRNVLQNIWRGIVGSVIDNIFPSNIFPTLLFPARFHQNCQAAFGHCGY